LLLLLHHLPQVHI